MFVHLECRHRQLIWFERESWETEIECLDKTTAGKMTVQESKSPLPRMHGAFAGQNMLKPCCLFYSACFTCFVFMLHTLWIPFGTLLW